MVHCVHVCVHPLGVCMGREGVWYPILNPVWWDSDVTRFYPLLRSHASLDPQFLSVCLCNSPTVWCSCNFPSHVFLTESVSLSAAPALSLWGLKALVSIRAVYNNQTANTALEAVSPAGHRRETWIMWLCLHGCLISVVIDVKSWSPTCTAAHTRANKHNTMPINL